MRAIKDGGQSGSASYPVLLGLVCEEYFHLTSTVQEFLRLEVVQSSADLEVPFSKYSSRVVGRTG